MCLFVNVSLVSFAQDAGAQRVSKYEKSLILTVGRSYFHVKDIPTESYPCWNVRAGARVSRKLNSFVALGAGLNVTVKIKRDPYLPFYEGDKFILPNLDETSARNHVTLELPVDIAFAFTQSLQVRVGLMARGWFPTDLFSDVLRSQQELGAIAGLSYAISPRVSINTSGYLGFTEFSYGLTNRFVDFGAAYKLGKRKA